MLPKQIKSTDITKVLYQLNLAADRRSSSDGGSLRSIADTVAVIGNDGARPRVRDVI